MKLWCDCTRNVQKGVKIINLHVRNIFVALIHQAKRFAVNQLNERRLVNDDLNWNGKIVFFVLILFFSNLIFVWKSVNISKVFFPSSPPKMCCVNSLRNKKEKIFLWKNKVNVILKQFHSSPFYLLPWSSFFHICFYQKAKDFDLNASIILFVNELNSKEKRKEKYFSSRESCEWWRWWYWCRFRYCTDEHTIYSTLIKLCIWYMKRKFIFFFHFAEQKID